MQGHGPRLELRGDLERADDDLDRVKGGGRADKAEYRLTSWCIRWGRPLARGANRSPDDPRGRDDEQADQCGDDAVQEVRHLERGDRGVARECGEELTVEERPVGRSLIAEAAKRDEVDLSLVSVDSTSARAHHDAAGMHLDHDVLTRWRSRHRGGEVPVKGAVRKGGTGGRPKTIPREKNEDASDAVAKSG